MRAAERTFVCRKQHSGRYQCKGYEEGPPSHSDDVVVSGKFARFNTDARIVRADGSARRCRTSAGRSWTCEHARADDELIKRLLTYFTLPSSPVAAVAEQGAERRKARAVQNAPTTRHVILINKRSDGVHPFWSSVRCDDSGVGSSQGDAKRLPTYEIGVDEKRYIKAHRVVDTASTVVDDALGAKHNKTVIALIAPSGAGKTHQALQFQEKLVEEGYTLTKGCYVYGTIVLGGDAGHIEEITGEVTGTNLTIQEITTTLKQRLQGLQALIKSTPLNKTSSRCAVAYVFYRESDGKTVYLVDAGGSEDESKIQTLFDVSSAVNTLNAVSDLGVEYPKYKLQVKMEGRYINCLLARMAQSAVPPDEKNIGPSSFPRTSIKIQLQTSKETRAQHDTGDRRFYTSFTFCDPMMTDAEPLRLLFDCDGLPLQFSNAMRTLGFHDDSGHPNAEVRLVFVVPDKLPATTPTATADIMAAAVSELVCLCNNQRFECDRTKPPC